MLNLSRFARFAPVIPLMSGLMSLPVSAQEACRSWEKKVTFADGITQCFRSGPDFVKRKGLIGSGGDSRSYVDVVTDNSSAAFAITADPYACPAAYGISWNWGNNADEALSFCQSKLKQMAASSSCQCEVVFDYDRSPLTSTQYLERLALLERQIVAGGGPLPSTLAKVTPPSQPVIDPKAEAEAKRLALELEAEAERRRALEAELAKARAEIKPSPPSLAVAPKQESEEVGAALSQMVEKLKALEDKLAQAQAKPETKPNLAPEVTTPTVEKAKTLRSRALVIGNSSYLPKVGALANPINDAQAIADRFIEMGIPTELVLDADRVRLSQALSRFQRTNTDVAILYYAGHGVTVNGENFMIPVDFNGSTPAEIELNAISINRQVNHLPGTTRLIFLDACRNPPATINVASSRSLSRGLSAMTVSDGTLISYATKDGSVADDGDGKHSPYTSALLKHLTDPDDIAIVLRRVRARVIEATSGRQQPWDYGSLGEGTIVLPALNPRR